MRTESSPSSYPVNSGSLLQPFANSGGFAFLVFHNKSIGEHVHLQMQNLLRNPGIFKVLQADFLKQTNSFLTNFLFFVNDAT